MTSLTAIIRTHNDAIRLGRALETLYACDEIVILDDQSTDRTVGLAYEYGAKVTRNSSVADIASAAKPGWIICLLPNESATEGLAASLYELKSVDIAERAYCVSLREETAQGWSERATIHTRVVPTHWKHWQNHLPAPDPSAEPLAGEILRFSFP